MASPLERVSYLMWGWQDGQPEPNWEIDCPYFETAEAFVQYLQIPENREGMVVGELYDAGDGIWVVTVDGQLRLTGYQSTRGQLFQAGAYDGHTGWWANNSHPQWQLGNGSSCTEIARDGWMDLVPVLTTPGERSKPWRRR